MPYGTLAIDSITPSANLLSVTGSVSSTGSVSCINTFGFKNRIINGAMRIAQRATSATITAGSTIAAGYSTLDRFYVYCTGANVTAAQVAGTTPILNNLQITGAASVTAVGLGQRIESQNSADLAGSTCTLSVNLSNSLLTTVTWTASYANTTNTFGTLAAPTVTQIATGTWTVNSTLANYNAQISVPSAATTGLQIVLTVGAQTSGTWTIGNVQLEAGTQATSFDYRAYSAELILCQRYCYKLVGGPPNTFLSAGCFGTPANNGFFNGQMPVEMRAVPTLALEAAANTYATYNVNSGNYTLLSTLTLNPVTSRSFYLLAFGSSGTPGTVGIVTYLTHTTGAFGVIFNAEL